MEKVNIHIWKDGRRGGAHLESIVGSDGWYYADNGKPFLVGEGFVNWSYSEDWLVFVSGNVDVGVDVERFSGLPYDVSDYGFVLSEEESRRVMNVDDFIRVWTRKESFVKLIGMGITDRLDVLDTYAMEESRDVYFNAFVVEDRSVTLCTRVPVAVNVCTM